MYGGTFWRSNLTDARLWQVNLANADFWKADLTKANLHSANCTNANFSDAILQSTNLILTDLTGACFFGTRPWDAILYSSVESNRNPEQYGYNQFPAKSLSSIEDALGCIMRLKKLYPTDITLYFRGESQTGWELRPSVMRDASLWNAEEDMLIDLMSRRPSEFAGIGSALDKWALAQHYGLKTRFLDITKNLLVALYHSCARDESEDGLFHIFAVPRHLIKHFNSNIISVITNFAMLPTRDQFIICGGRNAEIFDNFGDGTFRATMYKAAMKNLYDRINEEKPYFAENININDLFRVFIVQPRQFSERLRAQSGAFLISAYHINFDRDTVLKHNGQTPIYAHYSLVIPKEFKRRILQGLELLNITQETLFPGLDQSATAIIET